MTAPAQHGGSTPPRTNEPEPHIHPRGMPEDIGRAITLQLDPERIIATVDKLHRRIEERFPGSGLGRLASHLEEVARVTAERMAWVGRPHLLLRVGVGLVIAITLALLVALLASAQWTLSTDDIGELLQTIESALNEIILIGAALFFLVTVEGRIKRRRALRFLRELRAMAHLVDMHQLTKDPERASYGGARTASSPRHELTHFQLGRYLDYCSEMLSLISKLAALYAQTSDDTAVLAAVDEVETLTTGLSRKIWQKIMVLDRIAEEVPAPLEP